MAGEMAGGWLGRVETGSYSNPDTRALVVLILSHTTTDHELPNENAKLKL